MRWVTNKRQSEYMRRRQRQNRARGLTEAERWVAQALDATGLKWTRQAWWGCRIFDFWNAELGIAVEVDGPEHCRDYDEHRDRYNYVRSGILVLRVPNFDEAALTVALNHIAKGETHAERKARIRRELGLRPDATGKAVVRAAGLSLAHGRWEPPEAHELA